MKKLLRYIGLSYFSNTISKEARSRSYLFGTISIIFALGIILFGVLIGDMAPFSYHYSHASEYQEAIEYAFNEVDLNVTNGKLSASKNGQELLVDTFGNKEDRITYSYNDYQIVIDTRDTNNMYDDFIAYCVSNDGKNQEITYEEYLSLSEVAKRNFDFFIEYTGNELVLDEQKINTYRAYLDTIQDEVIKKEYEAIKSDDYKAIYELYVRSYYPSLKAYESSGKAPIIRNYYHNEFIKSNKNIKYIMLFDDLMVGSFVNDKNINISYYGFFQDVESMNVSGKEMNDFINMCFYNSYEISFYIYFLNMFNMIPLVVISLACISLLLFCVLKLVCKHDIYTFGTCFKITTSHQIVSSIWVFIIAIILGYFLPRGIFFTYSFLLFAAMLLIREAIFVTGIIVEGRKLDNKEN